jgi:asparagine synthase (glutamine-hydrolysing)
VCGINGIFAYHYAANPIDRNELRRTCAHMATRGPDGAGEWISADERVGFGHRRLAIIDLSDTGIQPMASADGKLVVTFNGEIFNYKALRQALEARGRILRSQSDTEVLLHLYAEKGEQMVHDLRGMFAFAIWDAERRRLFMARDPYGIKPLYYADDGWTLRFASQVKALLAGGRTRVPSRRGRSASTCGEACPSRSRPSGTFAHCLRVARLSSIGSVSTLPNATTPSRPFAPRPVRGASDRTTPATVWLKSGWLCSTASATIWWRTCPSAFLSQHRFRNARRPDAMWVMPTSKR